jgi:hypothetical protein
MIRTQVFTPVYRLEPETIEAVFRLEWPGPLSWIFQRDNPEDGSTPGGGRVNTLHQYQKARERFLLGNDDAMLVIESDIIPPADALVKLANLDADCAYGVYRFRTSNIINIFERYDAKPRNLGESLSIHPRKLLAARRRVRIPCSGAGLGCTLIKRHVLKAIQFRFEGERGAHCDTFFNRDVLQAGYSQMADMSVVCGHKTEEGEILWPF